MPEPLNNFKRLFTQKEEYTDSEIGEMAGYLMHKTADVTEAAEAMVRQLGAWQIELICAALKGHLKREQW